MPCVTYKSPSTRPVRKLRHVGGLQRGNVGNRQVRGISSDTHRVRVVHVQLLGTTAQLPAASTKLPDANLVPRNDHRLRLLDHRQESPRDHYLTLSQVRAPPVAGRRLRISCAWLTATARAAP